MQDLELLSKWRKPKNLVRSTNATTGLRPVESQLPGWIADNNEHRFGRPTDSTEKDLLKSNRVGMLVGGEYHRQYLSNTIARKAAEMVYKATEPVAKKTTTKA